MAGRPDLGQDRPALRRRRPGADRAWRLHRALPDGGQGLVLDHRRCCARSGGRGRSSFYSVSASHATDRTEPGQIAQVMSGMLFIWAAGSVIGPILTGIVADTQARPAGRLRRRRDRLFRPAGRQSLAACSCANGPMPSQRSPFMPVRPTSVVQGEVADEAERPAVAEAPKRDRRLRPAGLKLRESAANSGHAASCLAAPHALIATHAGPCAALPRGANFHEHPRASGEGSPEVVRRAGRHWAWRSPRSTRPRRRSTRCRVRSGW